MSNTLTIQATKKTPYVSFDPNKGYLEIKGYSLPGESQEFFNPLFSAIDEYVKNPQAKTEIVFHIEYFNTSSSKLLLQMLTKFEILVSLGKEVAFSWLVDPDDEDMRDAGLTYEASINIPTTIVEIN